MKKGDGRSFLCKWVGHEKIKSREGIPLDKRKEEQVMEKGKRGCRRQHPLHGDFYLYGRGCSWIFGVQNLGFQERARIQIYKLYQGNELCIEESGCQA